MMYSEDSVSKNKVHPRQNRSNWDQHESIPSRNRECCNMRWKKAIWIALAVTITVIILGVAIGVPLVMKMNQNQIVTNSPSLTVTVTLMNTTSNTIVSTVSNVPLSSTTATTTMVPPNLLVNPGAESVLSGWTQSGPATAIQDTSGTINSGYNPRSGGGMFAGGFGAGGSSAGLYQNVELLGGAQNFGAAQLDSGTLHVEIIFYYQNYYRLGLGTDAAEVVVTFRSATNVTLNTANSGSNICATHPGWCPYSSTISLPVGTRRVEYRMNFIRNGGTDIDSYIDDNSLRIL
ncbi:unnamed protein product [Adineta steineri]|uniref:Uncharacterized protein n=1 Tax=Adineta steineri TaxID=433720 RepID=A0A813WEQ5_9BILA|nr:unnamed protein product [Adineta steineri]